MGNSCPQCQGTGSIKEKSDLLSGVHTAWKFFIFFLLFALMMGLVSLFEGTALAIWAIVGAVVIYVLLSTGIVELIIGRILSRDKMITCSDCQGTGHETA